MDVNQGKYYSEEYYWDVVEDNVQVWVDVFNRASANNSASFAVVIICGAHQSKMFSEVLKTCAYEDIDEFTWCMTNVGGRNPGPNQRFVQATEHVITARSPKKASQLRMNPIYDLGGANSKCRYNFFFGPDLQRKIRNTKNVVVNPYQRPDWLASSLAVPFVKPYGTAVVFGGSNTNFARPCCCWF